MQKSPLFAAVSLALLVTACGGNPVRVAKDRDRADDRRRSAEAATVAQADESQLLHTALQNAVPTTHALWALPRVTSRHADAVQFCETLGFALPTSPEIQEFKFEVYDVSTSWQRVKFDRFFTSDVVEDKDGFFGFALCRRPHVQGINFN